MTLNWTPEAIIDFIVAGIIFSASLSTYIVPKSKKIISLFYIRSAIFLMGLYMLFEGLSFLYISILLHQIHTILLIPSSIVMLIGLNYTMKENFLSINLIPMFMLVFPLFYLTFQPGMIISRFEYGYQTVTWAGLLIIIGNLLQLYLALTLFYWALKTWINAPFLIKKEANLFMFGLILIVPGTFLFFYLAYWIPILILLSDLIFGAGIIVFITSIIKEPKLLYILPFKLNRIVVKDKDGFPLFDHDWSESDISEMMFTGFINAVQVMSEEVMNIGGLVDINLEEGMLILHESKSITVGLVASKSSKLLRGTLVNFSKDFEQQFERELKQKIKDTSIYDTAYLLIDKHFSNFPFRIIPSKKHPILLSGKYAKIPFELDNKLKDIFKDEKEYESIKAEISKSPICISEEFLNLYDDLKKEIDQLPDEKAKALDTNQSSEKNS